MTERRAAAAFACAAVAAFALSWTLVGLATPGAGALPSLVAGATAAAVVLILWLAATRMVFAPARRLARGLRTVRESRSAETAAKPVEELVLGELSKECSALVSALRTSRREVRNAVESEAAHMKSQKAWLESVLQGLVEGVFVCNRQHRILLYNAAALGLVGAPDRVGLGRSLGELIALEPLRHSLNGLEQRHKADPEAPSELSAPFVCTRVGGESMFHGRMALLLDDSGSVTGYLVTLMDISGELELLATGDSVRRTLTRDLRSMVGNLRAAAETMAAYPEMRPDDRAAFEKVVLDESARITDTIDRLGHDISGHIPGRWPMADLYVPDLVRFVDQGIHDTGIRATLVGMPLWLHGDSLSLVQALTSITRRLAEHVGVTEFDVEPMLGDKRVYLDLVWEGPPLPEAELEAWMDLDCTQGPGAQRLRDILERHDCEPWSRPSPRKGHSLLRLPLLVPSRLQFAPPVRRQPPRPEFYDFNLMQAHQGDTKLAEISLRDIEYAVFDCEMTGLRPNRGDEIIQIGAVRVIQGRVLTGEAAEWLVNPERPIPPGSIKFHGLTDADVAGEPPIAVVLPAFHAFVGDAVMVGHNVAFDMKFISLKERAANVRFENPVLDTMLISSMLDGDEEDHSLDALCARYGIAIAGRHTALGDTLGTAELLTKLIDRLEARGLTKFGEVMKASNMAAQLRHRGAMFEHGTGSVG